MNLKNKVFNSSLWFYICSTVMGGYIFSIAIKKPQVLILVAIYLVATLTVPKWIDRNELEPQSAKNGAFLWGAYIATFSALLANTFFNKISASLFGVQIGELLTAVICAPLVEEGLKTLGVMKAAKFGDLDTPIDGIVYATYTAIGFAAVENILYFDRAESSSVLTLTFILRAVMSPLAHPLFTMWTGKNVGKAMLGHLPIGPAALSGWVIGVCLHSGWNLLASLGIVFFITYPLWFVFFIFCAFHVRKLKNEELAQVGNSLTRLHSDFASRGLTNKQQLIEIYKLIEENSKGFKKKKPEFIECQIALYRLVYVSLRTEKDHELEDELIGTITTFPASGSSYSF